MFLNGVVPWAVYTVLSRRMDSIAALTIATLIPLLDNLVHFLRHKRLDTLGGLMLFGFLLSLVAAAAGGGERSLLLRESLVTGSVGLLFLGSLAFREPLMHHLAQKFVHPETFEANRKFAYFRTVMRRMTVVWGMLLLLESAARVILVYGLTTARFLAISPVMLYAVVGAAVVWTVWYRRKSSRRLAILRLQEG